MEYFGDDLNPGRWRGIHPLLLGTDQIIYCTLLPEKEKNHG